MEPGSGDTWVARMIRAPASAARIVSGFRPNGGNTYLVRAAAGTGSKGGILDC